MIKIGKELFFLNLFLIIVLLIISNYIEAIYILPLIIFIGILNVVNIRNFLKNKVSYENYKVYLYFCICNFITLSEIIYRGFIK